MNRQKNWGWLPALLLLAAACGSNNGAYDASGMFEATEVTVSSEVSGKLVSFGVDEGMQLDSGQVVGLVDTVQLYLKKRQLETSAGAVQSRRADIARQIAAIRQQIATARYEKERTENLLKANAANRKQLDDQNAQIALLEKQLAAQQSTLETTNSGLSGDGEALGIQALQIEDQILRSYISSPIAGSVLATYAEQGELAVPGRALFKVADMENMFLRAYVVSTQLEELRLGQEVTVVADYGGEHSREYPGRIVWISDKAEFTPKTIQTKDERANLVYAVKVALKNDGFVKIGMYGEMKINR